MSAFKNWKIQKLLVMDEDLGQSLQWGLGAEALVRVQEQSFSTA